MMNSTHQPLQPALSPAPPQRDTCGEQGYVLLSVLLLVALVLLALAVAAPRVADDIRRDREIEFYHRGLQYQQAIRLYYRKFGHYPGSIEQLEKSNEVRFLRQRYKDPFTGKDEWRLIHLGEAKVPAMGFFGQPLTIGVPAAAIGTPIGGDASAPGAPGSDSGSISTPGSTGSGSAGSGSTGPGSTGIGFGSTDSGTGSNTSSGDSGSPMPGGGPIMGVSSTSDKASIRTYHKQAHYNQWEFDYYPSQDQPMLAGSGGGGAPGGTTPGSPGTGPGIPGSPGPSPGNPPTDGGAGSGGGSPTPPLGSSPQ